MKRKLIHAFQFFMLKISILSLLISLLLGCSQTPTMETSQISDSSSISKADSLTLADIQNGIPIFYNMCLSVELSTMFLDANAIFDHELINPESNYINYQLSYDKALNLGVFAVDLCYSNVYEQYGYCSKYLQGMSKLSNELGIPYHFISEVSANSKSLSNSDSMYQYANKIYNQTNEYLKANDQEYATSLIITGGWVEAMYIAVKIAEQTASIKIIERIADQKNSINQLIDILNKQKNNQIVAGYIPKIKKIEADLNDFAQNYMNKSGINTFNQLSTDLSTLRNQITQTKAK